jgi:hypothetical protein
MVGNANVSYLQEHRNIKRMFDDKIVLSVAHFNAVFDFVSNN